MHPAAMDDGRKTMPLKPLIENALSKSSGNGKQAAAILAIGEATLYRKIRQYRIQANGTDAPA